MTHLLRQLVCFIVLRPSGQVASSICLHMYRPILFWCQWSPHSCRRHKSIKCMPCQGSLNHKPTMNLQLIYVLPANSCSTKWTNDLNPFLRWPVEVQELILGRSWVSSQSALGPADQEITSSILGMPKNLADQCQKQRKSIS